MKMGSIQDIEKNVPLGLRGILRDTLQCGLRGDTKFGKRSSYSVESQL